MIQYNNACSRSMCIIKKLNARPCEPTYSYANPINIKKHVLRTKLEISLIFCIRDFKKNVKKYLFFNLF